MFLHWERILVPTTLNKNLYPITHYYIDGGDADTDYSLRIFMDDDIYKEFKKEISEKPLLAIVDKPIYDIYGLPLDEWKLFSSEPINNHKEWILYGGHIVNRKLRFPFLIFKRVYVHNKYIEIIKE